MTFWDVQVNALKCLALIGLKFGLQDRIPIFKTWLYIRNFERKADKEKYKEAIISARDALEGLLYFRNSGYEPPHKGNVYVKETSVG